MKWSVMFSGVFSLKYLGTLYLVQSQTDEMADRLKTPTPGLLRLNL